MMSLELQLGARPSALALLCKSLDLVSADTVAWALPSSRIVFSAADGAAARPPLVSLSLGVLLGAILGVFLLGGGVGYVVGRRRREEGARETSTIAVCRKEAQKCEAGGRGEASSDKDGPTMVLKGALDLLSSKWGDRRAQKSSAVVEYLSPEEMSRQLFARMDEAGDGASQTLSLEEGDEDELVASPKSSTADIAGLLSKAQLRHVFGSKSRHEPMTPQAFLQLLSLIQKYSVDTSHPYFFNQLFGSLDPIALAAEIVALSVNTSVYTYETAPVFTLLEREVMGQIGRLVFAKTAESEGCDEEEEEEFEGEGLMIPGGSLANLTAMHAARHRWRAVNGYLSQPTLQSIDTAENEYWSPSEEEKKLEDASLHGPSPSAQEEGQVDTLYDCDRSTPDLVAFVSSEAHYSFSKSARVLGMREDDLIVIPTHADGRMNVEVLAKRIEELERDIQTEPNGQTAEGVRKRVPFFVACTAGSTVRGSFDEIAAIVKVCRDYESRGPPSLNSSDTRSIWVHVDGAWGGSAIFSARPSIRTSTHMDEIRHADSFTFNPHKMLGAPQQTTAFIVRHRNALRNANAAGARYLFDPRKNGAAYDLGDLSYTCGRRTDAVKLWALWKYYGRSGLGERVDCKVDQLGVFVAEMKKRKGRFALACKPWPFNVNFFYFPPRIRAVLKARGVLGPLGGGNDEYVQIPDDIAKDLANVSVALKLRLHEAGEMIIPYQPLNNQKADCFRLVLAGKKDFGIEDIRHVLDTMEKYGRDL